MGVVWEASGKIIDNMPKIYEYLGLIFFFYANDHPPIHCHTKKAGIEARFFVLQLDKITHVYLTKAKLLDPANLFIIDMEKVIACS